MGQHKYVYAAQLRNWLDGIDTIVHIREKRHLVVKPDHMTSNMLNILNELQAIEKSTITLI